MSWSQIFGHQRQIHAFRQIVGRRRLAHAYLFVGPPGIGKKLFARQLAKALLCEGNPQFPEPSVAAGDPATHLEACDQCEACLLVEAGTHPDLFVVSRPDDKNEIPVALMNELCRSFSFKTARGKGKIGIVDDADDLNEESANSFLKTLEEPPPGSVLILVGTSSDRQLATIRSRCQIVRFAPLGDDLVRQLLRQQGIEDADMVERLVRLAAGSLGQALALADDSLWQFRRTLLQSLGVPKVPSVDIARNLVEFVEQAGKEAASQRRRALQVLQLTVEACADALRWHAGAPLRSSDPSDTDLLVALAQRAQPDKILAMIECSLETETQLNRYVQVSLVLEGYMDTLGQLLEQRGPLPMRYQGFAGE